MVDFEIRAAALNDLPALTDIYNHYVVNTPITLDVTPVTVAERRPWFDAHLPSGRHRLFVAVDANARLAGYASSSRWRPKAGYDLTVETSVYCHPEFVGRGCGTALYRTLFEALDREDVHTIVAGIGLPNAASLALHERFGFRPVGVFHAVGRKFDQFWDVAWLQRSGRQR